MVAGFAQSAPNAVLLHFAEAERMRVGRGTILDIGCGAARNAAPLASQSWNVVGVDLSAPMLSSAVDRLRAQATGGHVVFARAAMDALPVIDASIDLVIAHGIWNLADSGSRFRRAVGEASRVAKRGAALFVFTFSRNTLPAAAQPVPAELFVFTQFSGRPQVFLTADQLTSELADAGFDPDPGVPLTEYNRRAPGVLSTGSGPVIYEAAFRYRG